MPLTSFSRQPQILLDIESDFHYHSPPLDKPFRHAVLQLLEMFHPMLPTTSMLPARPFLLTLVLTTLAAPLAIANERHFTLSYETATLPAGAVEIEPQTTFRMGREHYYLGMDHRLEFEFGITDRLMSAIYLNFGSETFRGENGIDATSGIQGVSSEWKYHLTDATADAIGSALYLELTARPLEYEIEGKLLLDKRLGQLHLVTNLIYEHGWEYVGVWNDEHKIAVSLGATYFLTEHFTLGGEAFAQGIVETDAPGEGNLGLQHGAVFVGPVMSYASRSWWVTTSVTPQIVGFGNAVTLAGTTRDLEDFHAVQARVILGIHL